MFLNHFLLGQNGDLLLVGSKNILIKELNRFPIKRFFITIKSLEGGTKNSPDPIYSYPVNFVWQSPLSAKRMTTDYRCNKIVYCRGSASRLSSVGWNRGDLKAERRIIIERCTIEYIWRGIGSVSFKCCMGDKLREQMEGGKRDETFLVHFNVHILYKLYLKQFWKL